ncbi:MAG: hypothetical protein ACLSVD_03700 [Eggerthellaceae bacterium]
MYRNEYEKQKLHLNNLKMNWEEAAEKGVFEWCTEGSTAPTTGTRP